jgi:hypothetical protein
MQTFYTNNFGLVQGEVISPIWFAAYVNDDKMEFIDNNYEPIELKKTVRLLVIFFFFFFLCVCYSSQDDITCIYQQCFVL